MSNKLDIAAVGSAADRPVVVVPPRRSQLEVMSD